MLYNKVKRHAYVLGPSAVRSLAALRAPAATGPRGVASTSPVQIASAQFSTWQTVFWGNSCPRNDRARERPGVQQPKTTAVGLRSIHPGGLKRQTKLRDSFTRFTDREGSGDMSTWLTSHFQSDQQTVDSGTDGRASGHVCPLDPSKPTPAFSLRTLLADPGGATGSCALHVAIGIPYCTVRSG